MTVIPMGDWSMIVLPLRFSLKASWPAGVAYILAVRFFDGLCRDAGRQPTRVREADINSSAVLVMFIFGFLIRVFSIVFGFTGP